MPDVARSRMAPGAPESDDKLACSVNALPAAAMTSIRQSDFIDSVADALQYISYYHPQDYIEALGNAYAAEQSPAAKDAIAQILTNSRMCAEGKRPLCQDTGIVVAFVSGHGGALGRRGDEHHGNGQRRRSARLH